MIKQTQQIQNHATDSTTAGSDSSYLQAPEPETLEEARLSLRKFRQDQRDKGQRLEFESKKATLLADMIDLLTRLVYTPTLDPDRPTIREEYFTAKQRYYDHKSGKLA